MAGQTSVSALFDNVFQNTVPPPPSSMHIPMQTMGTPVVTPMKKMNMMKMLLIILAVVGVAGVMMLFLKMKKAKSGGVSKKRKHPEDDDDDEDDDEEDEDRLVMQKKPRRVAFQPQPVIINPPVNNQPPQHQFPQPVSSRTVTPPSHNSPGFTETGGLPDSMLAPMPPPDYNPGSGLGVHLPMPSVPASAPLPPSQPPATSSLPTPNIASLPTPTPTAPTAMPAKDPNFTPL